MKRLGWYSRLCLILAAWWVPLATYYFAMREIGEQRKAVFDLEGLCLRRPVPDGGDLHLCERVATEQLKGAVDMEPGIWQQSFLYVLTTAALALLFALLAYWSVRFIFAGKQKYRKSVLTKDTDIR